MQGKKRAGCVEKARFNLRNRGNGDVARNALALLSYEFEKSLEIWKKRCCIHSSESKCRRESFALRSNKLFGGCGCLLLVYPDSPLKLDPRRPKPFLKLVEYQRSLSRITRE